MRKRSGKTRMMAWILSFGMLLSSSADSLLYASEFSDGTDGSQYIESFLSDGETDADFNDGEISGNDLSSQPIQEQRKDISEENLSKSEFAAAFVSVGWLDDSNAAESRYEDAVGLLELYGDGRLLSTDSYTLSLETEEPDRIHGMEFYTYRIESLPVYQEDGVTPVTYTISEKEELLPGYSAVTPECLPEADQSFLDALAAPGETILLERSEETGLYESRKRFGNYLSVQEIFEDPEITEIPGVTEAPDSTETPEVT